MSNDSKRRGDDFEGLIRKGINDLLELHSLPRGQWMRVNLKTFRSTTHKMGDALKTAKTASRQHIKNKGWVPQDTDETEDEN